ncbi:MAG: hypothetical protein F6K35_07945, partial [Okeania sp. SIO2H7]|nr:hypothetical protein [Okeania sp. SIO2H7]
MFYYWRCVFRFYIPCSLFPVPYSLFTIPFDKNWGDFIRGAEVISQCGHAFCNLCIRRALQFAAIC